MPAAFHASNPIPWLDRESGAIPDRVTPHDAGRHAYNDNTMPKGAFDSGAMKAFLLAIAVTAGLTAGPAAARSWGYPGFYADVQSQKGRPGPGYERREPPRDFRRDQRADDRRGQLTDDERRALHQDLDKANRELYRRRFQK